MATGSIQNIKGKFVAMIRYKEGGKTKQVCRSLKLPAKKENKRKAKELLNKYIQEFTAKEQNDIESNLAQNKMPKFADFINHWLKQKEAYVDKTTFQSYESIVHGHLIPYFESLSLSLGEVTYSVLQTYFDKKLKPDGDEEELSPRSLQRHKTILNQVITQARKMELISTNPCEFITLPSCEKKDISYYSEESIGQLLSALNGDPLADLVYITAVYGLRRSEVLGLKWDSIDFDNEALNIKYTVTRLSTLVEKEKTKNFSSHSSLPLLDATKEVFLRLKKQEEENRKLFKSEYHKNDYVFKWADGTPFMPDYVSHHFSKVIEKNNLPHITFHGLRHTCASIMVNQGKTPKDIQEWLRHSDIRTTMDIYGHMSMDRKKVIGEGLINSIREKPLSDSKEKPTNGVS